MPDLNSIIFFAGLDFHPRLDTIEFTAAILPVALFILFIFFVVTQYFKINYPLSAATALILIITSIRILSNKVIFLSGTEGCYWPNNQSILDDIFFLDTCRIFCYSSIVIFVECILFYFFSRFYHRVGFGAGRKLPRKLTLKGGAQHSNKYFLLTFDDGPSSKWTPQIIEILNSHNIKAIFFVVGKHAEENPEALKQLAGNGMEIGVHSYSHLPLPFLFSGKLDREIRGTVDIIKNLTGQTPRFFRPPWGFYNRRVIETAESYGLKTILWSRSSRDWFLKDPGLIVRETMNGLENGEILLFHDGCKKGVSRKYTVEALPMVLDALKSEGFQPADPSSLTRK